MKTWLKGGLIGLIVPFILFGGMFLFKLSVSFLKILTWPISMLDMIKMNLGYNLSRSAGGIFVLGFVFFAGWFLIGALICLIIGKIKSKKIKR